MSTQSRQTLRRALPPILLAAAGTWLLVGCIYIPTFNRVVRGRDVSSKVGDEGSKRPIRVGRTTRADVIRLLGEPTMTSRDWPRIAYQWNVMTGLMVFPLCFSATSNQETRAVVLTFDERDVLVSYRFTPHPVKFLVDVPRRQREAATAASQPASQRASESDERQQPGAH